MVAALEHLRVRTAADLLSMPDDPDHRYELQDRSCTEADARGGGPAPRRIEQSEGRAMRGERTVEQQLRLWADELRAIANEGLHWEGNNSYNARRCRRILRIAAEMFATQDTRPVDDVERQYHADLGHVAPYPVGDAAVFDAAGRILLIRRLDNGLWAMPGGAFEVGETPAEGACREAWEETGIEVEPVALSGVYDSRLCSNLTPYHLIYVRVSVPAARARATSAGQQ